MHVAAKKNYEQAHTHPHTRGTTTVTTIIKLFEALKLIYTYNLNCTYAKLLNMKHMRKYTFLIIFTIYRKADGPYTQTSDLGMKLKDLLWCTNSHHPCSLCCPSFFAFFAFFYYLRYPVFLAASTAVFTIL